MKGAPLKLQFAFCLRRFSLFAEARFLHLDGEEKFIEKEFPDQKASEKLLKADFRNQLVRKAQEWLVDGEDEATGTTRKTSHDFHLPSVKSEPSSRRQRKQKKLICGWFYSQKTRKNESVQRLKVAGVKGWIYATTKNNIVRARSTSELVLNRSIYSIS